MTTLIELQTKLKDTGRYSGLVDGLWGRMTEAAILQAMSDGPDTPLSEADYKESADRLGVPVACVKAVVEVESAGAGFFSGRPKILPEPHRFSKNTGGRYDRLYPAVSYPRWGTRPYPKTQAERYDLMLKMIHLDIDAGFKSASYGSFQIMGENYASCGYKSPVDFAIAQGRDEETQLIAFENFIRNNNLLRHLQSRDWARFAAGYNGSGYKKNQYDIKLERAYERHS